MAYSTETENEEQNNAVRSLFREGTPYTDSAAERISAAGRTGIPSILAEAFIIGLVNIRHDRENDRMVITGSANLALLLTTLGIELPEELHLP